METINNKLFTQPSCKFKFLSKEGFNIPKFYEDLNTYDDMVNLIKDKSKINSMFEIKGLVQESNEYDEDNDITSIYFDFDNIFETILTDVTWTLNTNGIYLPIAHFNSIKINDKQFNTASFKNVAYLESLIVQQNLTIGDTILVVLKDDNIPYILKVSNNNNNGEQIIMPTVCPQCNTNFEIFNAKITCNNLSCDSKVLDVLDNFITLLNNEYITPSLIKSVVSKFNVSSIDDLKQLSVEDIATISKDASLIHDILNNRHTVSKIQFLNLLQPSNNGIRVMSHIIDNTPIEVLLNDSTEPKDLFDISILDVKSKEAIEEALQLQLNTIRINAKHFDIEGNTISKIDGKIFCFTNTMIEKSMKEYEASIKDMGGIIGNVTQKLDYLISNERAKKSTKYKKVVDTNNKLYNSGKTHSINILTEEQFKNLME